MSCGELWCGFACLLILTPSREAVEKRGFCLTGFHLAVVVVLFFSGRPPYCLIDLVEIVSVRVLGWDGMRDGGGMEVGPMGVV